jgi:apolipoprotein N-acyltransferase
VTGTLTALQPEAVRGRHRRPSRTRVLRWSVPARVATGAVGGLAVWTSFPPLDLWPLALAGVALLWLACYGARARVAALVGLVAGLVQFVCLLTWLRVIGIDAWLVLALTQAIWLAALGAGLAAVGRLPAWPLWGAALWVAEEFGRSRVPFGGFSWGRLGFGQDGGPLLRYAAVAGAPLVTFAVALGGGLLAWLVLSGVRRRVDVRLVLPALAGLAAVVLAGLAVPVGTGGASHLRVAIVQGNVPRLGLDEFAQARAVVRNHAAVTERLAAEVQAGRRPAPQVVVWPENSSDFDPFVDAQTRALIEGAVRSIGVPTLVGAVLNGPGPRHVRNTGIVWDPVKGATQIYVKQHLVPFGEYVPFRAELGGLIGRLSLVPNDFVPGHRPGVLTLGPATIADVICFEVADDGVVREAVNGGGRLLVVQTNDATYEHRTDDGYGGEPAQQLAITRLRAVEHGRAAVVAATSGGSAVVAPDGTVLQRTGVFRPAILSADVPLRSERTLADRMGAWPERGIALTGVVVLAVAVALRRRQQTGEQHG